MTAIDRALQKPITIPCPACEGLGEITDDIVIPIICEDDDLAPVCPWCEGDGLVSPERALEFHRAKEAGRT